MARFHRSRLVGLVLVLTLLTGCGEDSGAPPAGPVSATPPPSANAPAVAAASASAVATAEPAAASAMPGGRGRDQSASAAPAERQTADTQTGQATPVEASAELLEEGPSKPKPTRLPADLVSSSKLTPLNPARTVLLDAGGKRVLVQGRVCLTEGQLEMLACLSNTKEHESIIVTDARAVEIHSGLLALGCEEGTPVAWEPEFRAPGGTTVDVFIHFVDRDGRQHRVPAQEWVRRSRYRYYEARFETLPADLKLNPDSNLRYDEMNRVIFWYGPMSEAQRDECLAMSSDSKFQTAVHGIFKDSQPQRMSADWVFVGSGFTEDGNERRYMAEGGYVICLANFPMAMLDVRENSSAQGRDSLTYEAWSERIPPQKSEVLLELVPRWKPASADPSATNPSADSSAPGRPPAPPQPEPRGASVEPGSSAASTRS